MTNINRDRITRRIKILNSVNVKRKREPKNTEESGANPIFWNPNKYAKPPRKNEIEFDINPLCPPKI